MRKTTWAVLGAVVAGGAVAVRRFVASEVASWDTNPDPTGGDPLTLPDGEHLWVEASDGAQLHGFRCGDRDGDTVIMIHGFTNSTHFWAPAARQLAEAGLDVVLLDQRGHGRSARGAADYSLATIADDVRCWLEHLDVRDAVLAGHSMGGVAVMSTAIHHPELVADRTRRLALVATLARPADVPIPDIPIDSGFVMRMTEKLLRRETLGLLAIRPIFGVRPARAALEATRAGVLDTDFDTRVDAYDMLSHASFDLRPGLATLDHPTAILAGSHDDLTPLELNQEIADLVPGAQLEVLPGIGHMIAFEAPDALVDLLLRSTKPVDAA